MANTYTQAYFHLVFAVENKKALINKPWKYEMEKYITSIVQNNKHKLIAIGSSSDHIHIFIGYNLNHKIPDLVEEIKTSSSNWVRRNKLSSFKFSWQNGYGAFTNSQSQVDAVAHYVINQEQHHRKTTFKEEYIKILKEYKIDYKNEYLFSFFDDK